MARPSAPATPPGYGPPPGPGGAAAFLPGLVYLDGLRQLWDEPHQQCLHHEFGRTVVVKVPA
ncbi:hypothetical protein SAMN05444365_101693 [Micromonospora pattaloongensis]|uniref:Uncharacterized protein n=1 Tax=Micromonospora pattaloongensis TaxID=405436 RepID=A0A1H3H5R6_9ACTN|nr:hypothetical protein SAMN05444365_101693 [Micromonospora pattaloongensis]